MTTTLTPSVPSLISSDRSTTSSDRLTAPNDPATISSGDPAAIPAAIPTLSVLVPTFNRAHVLGRVYESLKAQTFKNFDWIIVDDGSTDETAALVQSWIEEDSVAIVYHRKPNGGKHTAINPGVRLARGEYLVILDSDDWLVPNALERLLTLWNAIPQTERDGYSGVAGLCSTPDGEVIGDRFPAHIMDSDAVELSYMLDVRGDKISLIRTDVMREFPFPFQDVRGLVSESLVWNRIAQRYRQRCANEIFGVKEYLKGGLTDRALELQVKAAPATATYYLELARVKQPIPWQARLKGLANHVRFSLHAGQSMRQIFAQSGPSPGVLGALLLLGALPLGSLIYLRDRSRLG
jgi:glycosyltransferase involved in cell wall biosynthesis